MASSLASRAIGGVGSATVAITNAVVPSVGGSIDVVIVIQPDGTFRCSPFHVRFGKYQGLLKRREKAVKISVNDVEVDVSMQLSHTGEAYFVEPDDDETEAQEFEDDLAGMRSPIAGETSADDETEKDSQLDRLDSLDADMEGEPELEPSRWSWMGRWGTRKEAPPEVKDETNTPDESALTRELDALRKDMGEGEKLSDGADSDSNPRGIDVRSLISTDHDDDTPGSLSFASPPDGYLADRELPFKSVRDESNSPAGKSPTHANGGKGRFDECSTRLQVQGITSNGAGLAGEVATAQQQAGGVAPETNVELSHNAPMSLELSLCAQMLNQAECADEKQALFQRHLVSREVFLQDPKAILNSAHLVCRLNGSNCSWSEAATHLVGFLAFEITPFTPAASGSVETVAAPAPADLPTATPEFVDAESGPAEDSKVAEMQVIAKKASSKRVPSHKRKKVPTQPELAALGLKRGRNVLKFTFYTSVWGTQEVITYAYLWNWNSKVVISDVDGTITKSDMLGHILPMVGRDWSHSGIASLFRNISCNGYEFIYLTSRAIAQANITRDYLSNLCQDGENIPEGPLLMSPDSIGTSLYREVIKKTPHEFKIGTLQTIKDLFPAEQTPFYAGFGNRPTDEMSYAAVGVPEGKIFTINPSSQVACVVNKYSKTYTLNTINTLLDQMFPPVKQESDSELPDQEGYNTWNFWKPIPCIVDIDDDELENA
ncbi:hypothetical protein CYMTET_16253 [Cymbomonas tetramitiformis]|uniref:phosphatidate phosphatase n=1 Tax=Cymbomonas tetramitiformis TaxID=36881 RepID=A0AAE0GCK1_9CHLO|nr:hypothetical protein CYMTET_16253 [Cymbomonas tetramitiformis]